MKIYVIDASVVAKALLSEERTVESFFQKILGKALRKEILILSSKFLLIEVANALRFGVKDRDTSTQVLKDFFALPIKTVVPSKSALALALALSYEIRTTVYDTLYHVLAQSYGATFLTCDDGYYRKAKKLGDIDYVG